MSKVDLSRSISRAHPRGLQLSSCVFVLLVVSTLAVLLLPLAAGPYTATNGPATAFRSATAGWLVLLAITSVFQLAVEVRLSQLLRATGRARRYEFFNKILPSLRC